MNAPVIRSLVIVVLILGFVRAVDASEPRIDSSAPQVRTVPTAGLDVARLADVEVLYGRMRAAARSACRAQKAVWDVKRVFHSRLCVERAVEDAVVRADQALLTTVHRSFGERFAGR